jgi:hypothetical protein
MRVASRLRSALASSHEDDGVAQFGTYWYAWRDGFLIVSTSKEYVRATLKSPPPRVAKSNGSDELRLSIPSAHEALFRLHGKNGWPVEGQIRVKTGPRKEPLSLVNVWPAVPMCTIAAPRWTDVVSVLNLVDEPLQGKPWRAALGAAVAAADQHWAFDALPSDWDVQT